MSDLVKIMIFEDGDNKKVASNFPASNWKWLFISWASKCLSILSVYSIHMLRTSCPCCVTNRNEKVNFVILNIHIFQ